MSTETQSDTMDKKNKEFDFIINSIWSTFVNNIDLNLSILFSPADPDIFHQRYTASFDFILKLESKCALFEKDIKVRLQKSQSYKHFVKKWPVQVYFQIRFQEIVSKFEEQLIDFKETLFKDTIDIDEIEISDRNQNVFNLKMSETLVRQMEYCWNENDCFLKCLISQFWKLNLQLVSRYCSYFVQYFQNKSNSQVDLTPSGQFAKNLGTEQQNEQRTKTPIEFENIGSQSISNKQNIDDLTFGIFLLLDVHKLHSQRVISINSLNKKTFFSMIKLF